MTAYLKPAPMALPGIHQKDDPVAKPVPPPWHNLLLVRHGESTCNEVNRFAGSADAPLTALGRAQAQWAKENWRESLPDLIIVSPLSRARETAEIIFPGATVPQVIDRRITERHFGEFTLCNKADLQNRMGIRGYDEALYDACGTIEGAETPDQFHSRVSGFLFDEVVPLLASGRRVLVVAHKYVVELIARLILDLPLRNGFDLRLPNSKVLNGANLEAYCKRENRSLNRIREWGALHHDWLLACSALAGTACSFAGFGAGFPVHWTVGVALLMLATFISLTRVDLERLSSSVPLDWIRVLIRFAVLPGAICYFGFLAGYPALALFLALLSAAPSAMTVVTLSRCAGGMILPALGSIFRSSAVGCISIVAAFQFRGSTSWMFVPLLAGVAFLTILAPALVARWFRRRAPIGTASFGERQAVWSVLLLSGFVFLACSQLDLSSFSQFGVLAFVGSLLIRGISWSLARHKTVHTVDDYLAMAYPNLFLILIMNQLLGLAELSQVATWFLLFMFLLSPLDAWICRRMSGKIESKQELKDYLGISKFVKASTLS